MHPTCDRPPPPPFHPFTPTVHGFRAAARSPTYRHSCDHYRWPLLAPQAYEEPGPPQASWLMAPLPEELQQRRAKVRRRAETAAVGGAPLRVCCACFLPLLRDRFVRAGARAAAQHTHTHTHTIPSSSLQRMELISRAQLVGAPDREVKLKEQVVTVDTGEKGGGGGGGQGGNMGQWAIFFFSGE